MSDDAQVASVYSSNSVRLDNLFRSCIRNVDDWKLISCFQSQRDIAHISYCCIGISGGEKEVGEVIYRLVVSVFVMDVPSVVFV